MPENGIQPSAPTGTTTRRNLSIDRQTVPSAGHFFAATTDNVADLAVNWALAHAVSKTAARSG